MSKNIGQIILDTYEDPLSQLIGQIREGTEPIYLISCPEQLTVYFCDEPFTIEDIKEEG